MYNVRVPLRMLRPHMLNSATHYIGLLDKCHFNTVHTYYTFFFTDRRTCLSKNILLDETYLLS